MKIYLIERPSLPLTPVCAPSVPVMPSRHESVVLMASKRTPLSQMHQAQAQAELAWTSVLGDSSGNGTTGFVGNTGISATGGARGVPPRGRPV